MLCVTGIYIVLYATSVYILLQASFVLPKGGGRTLT